jgi:hypothetical protein
VCDAAEQEPGYEKITIYVKDSTPAHVARQLPSGEWTSKLGGGHDIRHEQLSGLEGDEYGEAVAHLKRRIEGIHN